MVKHRKLIRVLLIELAFLAIAIIAILPVLIIGKGVWSTDNIFHWERIYELAKSISHGMLPQFNNFTGYRGNADMTFYPWLTLTPLALMVLAKIPPIIVMDTFITGSFFIGLNIAFYAYHKCYSSINQGLVFAGLYVWTPLFTSMYEPQGEDAELLAVMIAPLAFFGWLRILQGHKSYMLLIGLTLMMYTHLLDTLILVLAFTIMTPFTLLKEKPQAKTIIKRYVKSALWFFGLTCAEWLPMLILSVQNNIIVPPLRGHMKKYAITIPTDYREFILAMGTTWCAAEFIGLILGAVKWRSLNYIEKVMYGFAIFVLLTNVKWPFWDSIEKTFIGHIQFPFRVAFLAHLLLVFLIIRIAMKDFAHEKQAIQAVKVVGLAVMVIFSFVFIQYKNVTPTSMGKDVHFSYTNPTGRVTGKKYLKQYRKAHGRVQAEIELATPALTNHQMDSSQLINTMLNPDYAEESPIHYLTHHAPSHEVHFHGGEVDSGFRIKSSHYAHDIVCPIMRYHGQKYQMYINHKLVKHYPIKRTQPMLREIKPHKNYVVKFCTPVEWYRWLSLAISIISLIILSFCREIKFSRKGVYHEVI